MPSALRAMPFAVAAKPRKHWSKIRGRQNLVVKPAKRTFALSALLLYLARSELSYEVLLWSLCFCLCLTFFSKHAVQVLPTVFIALAAIAMPLSLHKIDEGHVSCPFHAPSLQDTMQETSVCFIFSFQLDKQAQHHPYTDTLMMCRLVCTTGEARFSK